MRGDFEKYGRVVDYSGLGERTIGFGEPDTIRDLMNLVIIRT